MKKFICGVLRAVVMTAGVITICRSAAGLCLKLAEKAGGRREPEDDGHFCFGDTGDCDPDETWEYDEHDFT